MVEKRVSALKITKTTNFDLQLFQVDVVGQRGFVQGRYVVACQVSGTNMNISKKITQ